MPGHGIGMYGICPASAITQVGDRLGCDSDQRLVVAAQALHGGKCRVTNPHFEPTVTAWLCLTGVTCSTSHCGPFLVWKLH